MAKISIKAEQGVYLSYKNYPYEAAQVFGEYIDNAIQSNEDHRMQLLSMTPGYELRVDITIDWEIDNIDKTVRSSKITIQDNAAGMTEDVFKHAFNLADDTVTRKGMNEFGIGMKAASAWFGNNWHIETTSVDDRKTRILDVDLTKLADEQITELEYREESSSSKIHGTTVVIENLWKDSKIKKDTLDDLERNIASIYRNFIRNNEIQIYLNDTLLSFDEYEVLKAPWYECPDDDDIEWKTAITIDDHEGHVISGFLALLSDMSDNKRGVVFTRNRRVVLGFDPNYRTVGKVFIGQIGSAKYRRVFGEFELTGFSVAFGKNSVNDIDLLESLCKAAAAKAKIENYNLLKQGEKFKTKSRKKKQHKVPPIENPSKGEETDITTVTIKNPLPSIPVVNINPKNNGGETVEISDTDNSANSITLDSDTFEINGTKYTIDVIESIESSELFWNEHDPSNACRLICKVNTEHPFFSEYGRPSKPVLMLIKALSISKFSILKKGQSSASDMMNEFNILINELK